MDKFKSYLIIISIFLSTVLLIGSPMIYVVVDILMHPESEDIYRLEGIGGWNSRSSPINHSKYVLSPENIEKKKPLIEYNRKRKTELYQALDELKKLRKQEETIYEKIQAYTYISKPFSLHELLGSFMLGVLSSLVATYTTFKIKHIIHANSKK